MTVIIIYNQKKRTYIQQESLDPLPRDRILGPPSSQSPGNWHVMPTSLGVHIPAPIQTTKDNLIAKMLKTEK